MEHLLIPETVVNEHRKIANRFAERSLHRRHDKIGLPVGGIFEHLAQSVTAAARRALHNVGPAIGCHASLYVKYAVTKAQQIGQALQFRDKLFCAHAGNDAGIAYAAGV